MIRCSCGMLFEETDPYGLYHALAEHDFTMTCGRKLGPFDCCSVVEGDCLELMRELPDGCVDVVLTDPQYGVGLEAKQNKWVHNEGDGYAATDDTPEYVLRVCVSTILEARRKFKRVVVTPGDRMAFSYPQPDALGSIFNLCGAGRSKWGFGCSTPVMYYGKDPYIANGLGGRPNSWNQPVTDFAEKNGHPCPKPMGMMMWLVNRSSLEGETILDPFCGSGTTLVAAKKLGRHFLGMEISPAYVAIARDRLARVEAQPNLFAPKAEQLELPGGGA